jgi:hypothetical protein
MSKRLDAVRYCGRGLPRQPIPDGRFLVHNHVFPEAELGQSGFRAWTQGTRKHLVRCYCDFGGCKNAELHKHYRIQSGKNAKEKSALKASYAASAHFIKTEKLKKQLPLWEAHQERRRLAVRAGYKAYREAMRP